MIWTDDYTALVELSASVDEIHGLWLSMVRCSIPSITELSKAADASFVFVSCI